MRPAAALAHALDHRPRHGEHRIEVGAQHRRPLLVGHLVEHAVARDAGIVDEHVDRPELGLDLLDAGGAGGGSATSHLKMAMPVSALNFAAASSLPCIGRGDRVAGRLQPLGDRGADAARAPRDDGDLRHGRFLPSCSSCLSSSSRHQRSTHMAMPMPPPMQSVASPCLAFAALHLVEQRHQHARARGADRMADGDGAAIDVDDVRDPSPCPC